MPTAFHLNVVEFKLFIDLCLHREPPPFWFHLNVVEFKVIFYVEWIANTSQFHLNVVEFKAHTFIIHNSSPLVSSERSGI